MNCQDFEPILVEAARGATNSEALAHVAGCDRCAAKFANERALTGGFAGIVAQPAEAPLDLERKLLAAFEKNAKRRAVFTWGRIAIPAAIAAALTFAIVRRVPPPETPNVVRFEDPLPVLRDVAPVISTAPPARRRIARARIRKPPQPAELAEEFMPIPFADPLTSAERADVIRVKVEQPDGFPLQADVVVGQDGLARAIRFIKTYQ